MDRMLVCDGRQWIKSETGTVVGANKHSTMSVSGSGGGASGNSNIRVSSDTTIHNDIFLQDAKGDERSFQLRNFDVACREGHVLSVVWLGKNGRKFGQYCVVHNHTTDQVYTDIDNTKQAFQPYQNTFLRISVPIAVYVVSTLLLSALGGVALFIGFFVALGFVLVFREFVPKSKAKAFLASDEYKAYCEKLNVTAESLKNKLATITEPQSRAEA